MLLASFFFYCFIFWRYPFGVWNVSRLNKMSGPYQQSPEDAVKSTSNMTDGIRQQLENARKNPEKELGITKEELQARQKEAMAPRKFVSEETKREFDVKSSARAQQIMNKGINKIQREKRQRELKDSLKILRKFQIVLSVFGAMFIGWISVEYLLPQYAAVQERNRRMQIRYQRAQARLEEIAREQHLDKEALQPGLVIVTKKGQEEKQTIQ